MFSAAVGFISKIHRKIIKLSNTVVLLFYSGKSQAYTVIVQNTLYSFLEFILSLFIQEKIKCTVYSEKYTLHCIYVLFMEKCTDNCLVILLYSWKSVQITV